MRTMRVQKGFAKCSAGEKRICKMFRLNFLAPRFEIWLKGLLQQKLQAPCPMSTLEAEIKGRLPSWSTDQVNTLRSKKALAYLAQTQGATQAARAMVPAATLLHHVHVQVCRLFLIIPCPRGAGSEQAQSKVLGSKGARPQFPLRCPF